MQVSQIDWESKVDSIIAADPILQKQLALRPVLCRDDFIPGDYVLGERYGSALLQTCNTGMKNLLLTNFACVRRFLCLEGEAWRMIAARV
jgi:hypothetical protein